MGLGTDIRYWSADEPVHERLCEIPVAELRRSERKPQWDGYRFKVSTLCRLPIFMWGGQLSYIGFDNFDWGSDLGDDSGYANNGIKTRTNNSIAVRAIFWR